MVVCGVPALDAVLAQNDHRTQTRRLSEPTETDHRTRRATGDHDNRAHKFPEPAKCCYSVRIRVRLLRITDDRGQSAVEIRRNERLVR